LAIGRTLKTPPSARSFLLCSLGPPAGLQVVPWRSISSRLDGAFRPDDFVLLGVFAGSAGRHCVFQGPHQSDAPASAFALCQAISKLPGHGPGSIAPTPTPHRRQIIVYSLYFNPHTHCLSGLGQRPPKLSIKCRLVDALPAHHRSTLVSGIIFLFHRIFFCCCIQHRLKEKDPRLRRLGRYFRRHISPCASGAATCTFSLDTALRRPAMRLWMQKLGCAGGQLSFGGHSSK